jgi:hypothetical protein
MRYRSSAALDEAIAEENGEAGVRLKPPKPRTKKGE